jgi:integrase
MSENGRKLSTVGFYLRNLRTIINSMSDIYENFKYVYPFGLKSYIIPSPSNVKKALDDKDLSKIFTYNPTATESKYYNYWKFMYLCNGINPIDMFGLKYSNIDGKYIYFSRQKTKKSNRSHVTIKIFIHPIANEIIASHGNKVNKDSFIFPVFENEMKLVEKKRIISNMVKNINKHMRIICKKMGIVNDVTTYVARHSFATKSINNNMSLIDLKDSLGHASVKITEGYVKSLQGDKMEEYSNLLTNF